MNNNLQHQVPRLIGRSNGPDFKISSYDKCYVEGTFESQSRPQNGKLTYINIAEGMRGTGESDRLLKGFFGYCIEQGAETITADIVNPSTLSAFVRVLGEKSLMFYEVVDDNEITLPITVKQAHQSSTRLAHAQYATDPTRQNLPPELEVAIAVRLDLHDIDMNEWESAHFIQPVKAMPASSNHYYRPPQ